MEGGAQRRTCLSPGEMTPSVRKTSSSKTRWVSSGYIHTSLIKGPFKDHSTRSSIKSIISSNPSRKKKCSVKLLYGSSPLLDIPCHWPPWPWPPFWWLFWGQCSAQTAQRDYLGRPSETLFSFQFPENFTVPGITYTWTCLCPSSWERWPSSPKK